MMRTKIIYILIILFTTISLFAQVDIIIDDPQLKEHVIQLIQDELGPIPNLSNSITVNSHANDVRQISGVNELFFANWEHDVLINGNLLFSLNQRAEGNSLADSFQSSSKKLSLTQTQIEILYEKRKKYFNNLNSVEDDCDNKLSYAKKAAEGYDFGRSFSMIQEVIDVGSQQCDEFAYETINDIFNTHSEYLCSQHFTHVEVEIANGNYQKALEYLDGGAMIPPCHLQYKTEILRLIDKASSAQLIDKKLKGTLQKQVNGLGDITLSQTFSFLNQWHKNFKNLKK